MTGTYLLLLIVLTSAMSTVAAIRGKAVSWVVVNAAFAVAAGIGYLMSPERAGLWLIGPYLLFAIVPLIAYAQTPRLMTAKRHRLARALARISFVLHPTAGNRRLVRMTDAFQLAADGKLDEATEILRKAGHAQDLDLERMRLANAWPDIIAYIEAATPAAASKPITHPAAVLYMRALGETGQLDRLVNGYFDALELWAKRDDMAEGIATLRMFLAAFLGQPALVEQIYAAPLRKFPPSVKQYWLAIAHAAGGDRDRAAAMFEELSHDPEQRMASAAAARIAEPPTRVEQLGPDLRKLVAEIERDVRDTATYAGQHAYRKRPVLSYAIIATLVAVHGFVVWKQQTDPLAIYDVGLFWSPDVLDNGEWWRVVTAAFLHASWMHLAMNVLGLLWFGPFVERFLGRLRFAIVYLAGGIGGFVVLAGLVALGWRDDSAALGASGSVMALIGASIGIFVRGSSRSQVAANRLRDMLSFVAIQVVFDILAPRVSMTAHVSGLLIGAALGLLMTARQRD